MPSKPQSKEERNAELAVKLKQLRAWLFPDEFQRAIETLRRYQDRGKKEFGMGGHLYAPIANFLEHLVHCESNIRAEIGITENALKKSSASDARGPGQTIKSLTRRLKNSVGDSFSAHLCAVLDKPEIWHQKVGDLFLTESSARGEVLAAMEVCEEVMKRIRALQKASTWQNVAANGEEAPSSRVRPTRVSDMRTTNFCKQ